jgi:hypothetical protein
MKKAILCVLLMSSVTAQAEQTFPEDLWGKQQISLLKMKTIIPSMGESGIPSPPDAGSPEALAEISEVIALQEDPYNGRRRINARDALELPVGDLLRKRNLMPDPKAAPSLWSLAANLDKDISIMSLRESVKYMRQAPHAVSEDVQEMAGHVRAPAFPSLKYARIHAVTSLLKMLDKTCSEDYDLMLADTAVDMKFSGQHRASDIRSAAIISVVPLAYVKTSESLREQLIRAETELGIHVRTSGCPFDTDK